MRRQLLLATALLSTLTLSACDALPGLTLPPGDKTSPYYWGELFLNLYADERALGVLEPGPAPLDEPRVVLLITGVTIPAEWFDPIAARLERDGFIPVVYEPPALLSGDLFQASEDLARVVDQVRADSGQDKIDILAECTAGVVARHYVQSMGGDQKVSRLVTFVSPHHGIAKAPLAAALVGWPALYDLSPGSPFLEAVNNAPLPPNLPVTSIYTCSDEYIQPWQGSIVPGANNIGLCDGSVGHFQTFYDPAIYEIMYAALTEPTEEQAPEGDTEGTDEGSTDDNQEEAWEQDTSDDADDLNWDIDPPRDAVDSDESAADADRGDFVGEHGGDPIREVSAPMTCTAAPARPSNPAGLTLWALGLLGAIAVTRRRRS